MTSPSYPAFRSPLALALLAVAFLIGPLAASILQGPGTNHATGHTYSPRPHGTKGTGIRSGHLVKNQNTVECQHFTMLTALRSSLILNVFL